MSATKSAGGAGTGAPVRSPVADSGAFRVQPPPAIPARGRIIAGIRRVAPFAIWATAAVAGARLWLVEGVRGDALAFADTVELQVAPAIEGRLVHVDAETGLAVKPGDVLAQLDTQDVDGQIAVTKADGERVRAMIRAQAEAWRVESADRLAGAEERRRARALDVEALRGELDRHEVDQAADEAEAAALGGEISRLALSTPGASTSDRLADLSLRRAALAARIARRTVAIEGMRARSNATLDSVPSTIPVPEVTSRLEPLELELRVIDLRLAELAARRERCVVRAPAAGVVASVSHHGGEWVATGVPVATIVVSRPGRVVAYVTYNQLTTVKTGVKVALRPHDHVGERLHGTVIAVAPRLEPAPARLKAVLTTPPWGRLATIQLDGVPELVPNEIYDARFEP